VDALPAARRECKACALDGRRALRDTMGAAKGAYGSGVKA
jgi:hypothetical protein